MERKVNVLLSSGSKVRFPLIGKIFILMFLLLGALPGQVLAQLSCVKFLELSEIGAPFYEGDTVTIEVGVGADNITGGAENTITIDAFHFGPDCAEGEFDTCTSQGNTITYVPGSVTSDCYDGSNPDPIVFDVALRAPELTILDFTPAATWGSIKEAANSSCLITFDLLIDNFVSPPGNSYIVFEAGGWAFDEARCDNTINTAGSAAVAFVVNEPAIDIEKSTNGVDSDVAPGESIMAGDPVVWEYVVTNTGNVPLVSVGVVDDMGVVVTCPTDTLDPEVSTTCTAPAGVAQIGQYTNTGTASGTPTNVGPDYPNPVGPPVTDSDPSNYFGLNPDFTIEKSSPQYPGPLDMPGTVTYNYLVLNTGNMDLTSLALVDTNTSSAPVCSSTTLVVGGSTICSATHEFTQEELDAGGNDDCGLYNHVTATTDQVGPRSDELCIPVMLMGVAVPTVSDLGLMVMAALLLLTGLLIRRIG
jgi:hypothetical protein